MLITGRAIKRAMKRWREKRDSASEAFNESIMAFDDDEWVDPVVASEDFRAADQAICLLEVFQQDYNKRVMVSVDGEEMSLALAIKLVGGAGRLKNMWKSASARAPKDRYSRLCRDTSRRADEERATRRVSIKKASEKYQEVCDRQIAIQDAITIGNGVSIEMDIDPVLLT